MPIITISSLDDTRLDAYRALTDVALRSATEPASGLYIAESAKVISRALAAGHTPVSILMEHSWLQRMQDLLGIDFTTSSLEVFVGGHELLEELTGFHVHRGALAAMQRPVELSVSQVVEDAKRIVVLENIVDHTNVGAIFRSAAGLGVDAILVTPRCADPLYRRSIRVSMGAVFSLPWSRIHSWPDSLADLTAWGFHTVALSPGADSPSLEEFVLAPPDKIAFVLGAEGHGLTAESLQLCESVVHIPMSHSVDSLNVAAASAVVFWAMRARTG
ncbi:MAG: RNA methyltransferase [Candidatus Nanopelagicales bacterium]|nr:RNA methyltransferase [Candidatus Nanopelagicales bacterium]